MSSSDPSGDVGAKEALAKTDPVRLSSFRPPRDLMLNKQAPKRVFTPNLNATRNKTKSVVSVNDVKKDRRKHDKFNGRDKKFSQNKNSNILKSSGVFSDGIAASNQRRYTRENYSGGSSKDSSTILTKPVFNPRKANRKINEDLQELKIKDYSSEEEASDTLVDNSFLPILLPMEVESGSSFIFQPDDIIKFKPLVKQEVITKTEPADGVISQTLPEPAIDLEGSNVKMENGIFATSKNSFIMLQFPDCLPGRGPNENDAQDKTDDLQESNVENLCKFENLEEGQIGKILLYKSGKLKLKMGNIIYDLALGSQTCFRQEVMSIETNTDEKTGKMINLGNIRAKIMAIPDWERILNENDDL